MAAPKSFSRASGVRQTARKIVVYGPGGIGKTELAGHLRQIGMNVLYLDVEGSTSTYDLPRVAEIDETSTWQDLRDALHCEALWQGIDAIILDSATKAEETSVAHVLGSIPHEKGHWVAGIEDYGWGKGFTHVYEQFLLLLGDLDHHVRAGRTVVLICHDCIASVPNPEGDDFIRFEPRLQTSSTKTGGKASIRNRVKEWCNDVFFIGYDVFAKDGKARGAATRTIYPVEMPTHVAKSRDLSEPIVYQKGDAELWRLLFGKQV